MLLEAAGFDVAAAVNGGEALTLARRKKPGLAIVDVRMPDMSGYEVCRALKAEFGAALPVMFVSGERVESFDRTAGLMIGADDYVVKPYDPGELLARVQTLVQRSDDARERRVHLTPRERDVLRLLVDGLAHGEVARTLGISPKTVGTHVERIYRKLGVRSRAHAVARALRDQLLGIPR